MKAVNNIYSGCTMSLESVNTTSIPGDVSPLNGSPTARDYSIFHDVIPASEASVASVVSLDSSSTCSASPFSWKKATQLLTGSSNLFQKDVIRHGNCPLRFLILLREEDYKRCFFRSRKDRIVSRKSNFPGKLTVERFSEAESLPFMIEGPPLPRTLYVMLPKEKLFIPLNRFTSRYIDSKLQELKSIFVSLRAKSIKMKKTWDSNTSVRVAGDVESILSSYGSFGSDVHVEQMDGKQVILSSEMRFDKPSTEMDMQKETDFFSNETVPYRFYYLGKEHEWQNIIQRRLKDKMIFDKYVYRNTEQKLFSGRFLSALKLLDISAEYDWKKIQHLQIEYEIEYWPLESNSTKDLPCHFM